MGEVSTHFHGSMTLGGRALQYKGVLKWPEGGRGGGGSLSHIACVYTVSFDCFT